MRKFLISGSAQFVLMIIGSTAAIISASKGWLVLHAAGWAVFGSAIGTLVASQASVVMQQNVSEMLKVFLRPDLHGNAGKVAEFRNKFDLYYVTENGSSATWRKVLLDFSKSPAGSCLYTEVNLKNLEDNDEAYNVELQYRDGRVVIFMVPKEQGSQEPALVFNLDYLRGEKKLFGTLSLWTWRHSHFLSTCIFTPTKSYNWHALSKENGSEINMKSWNARQNVPSDWVNEQLDEYWLSGYASRKQILPRVFDRLQ